MLPPSAVLVSALLLAGCAGTGGVGSLFGGSPQPEPVVAQPEPMPEIPATIRASEIVGRWGYAAFHRPDDRARTEANARGQCRQAVVINPGPSGGVMMYLADQPELQELRLKGGPNNRNFIGPAGEPAGGPQDREIVSFDGRVMLLRFTNPEVDSRYGTGIYVRCAPTAGGVAQSKKKK
ncbi:MAG: hypothetical protein IT536_18960 [Hyphomicrobiales bacterium]|nr:hypothetical protein [Hyphomicrobiales bacterium]